MDYSTWVGRTQTRHDSISPELVTRIAGTLSEPAPDAGEPLPLLWHWAFFQEAVAAELIGEDGHPVTGGFLPDVGSRARMWAGGRLAFSKPLKVGVPAKRVSTIEQIQEKEGRSGSLLFVTVKHSIYQHDELMLTEEQDIVYRDPSPYKAAPGKPAPEAEWREQFEIDPVMLFRYSAVTFNGHRIHYDWRYVTETEGYPGLVVHGPLTATLVLRTFTKAKPDAVVRSFAFKGVQPIFSDQTVEVGGLIESPGVAQVWAATGNGISQTGQVTYE
ncbi:conserved protein of unknown function [Pseudomonas sp. JV551A1]|uniref:FAS1-like dehydratase domain-containing protein n=1 Tax=Pseudomonas sp. JV551A1 TaxID=2078787 RepID=UPI00100D9816|nr:MaoC family dehydratase N-terminal domain-containing protein [Pseudomonas sp. JV551A1]SPO55779.1 conserved protein of unknown function [Pseudomonas sp. JV551A1]